jgi:hypothetical protein
MIKPQSPEVGVWKENVRRTPTQRIKPTSGMLIENYHPYRVAARASETIRATNCLFVGDGLYLDKLAERGSDAILLCGGEGTPAHGRTQAMEHVMMVGEWPCRLSKGIAGEERRGGAR